MSRLLAVVNPSLRSKILPILAQLLLTGAMVVSIGLLAQFSGARGGASGCPGGGCEEVLASRWGAVFGIPVVLFGLLSYMVLFGAANRIAGGRKCGWLTKTMVVLVPLVALWFVGLQWLVIGDWCSMCCSIHAMAVAAAFLLAWEQRDEGIAGFWERNETPRLPAPVAGALLAVGTLAILQIATPEPPSRAEVMIGADAMPMREAGSARESLLLGGAIEIDPAVFPVAGDAEAENLGVALVNFGCHHCRRFLKSVDETVAHFGKEKLGVILMLVGGDEDSHRLLLATWKADRDSFWTLAKRFAEGDHGSGEVRRAAADLLGEEALDTVLEEHGAWFDEQLALAQEIREANQLRFNRDQLPQLMMRDRIIVGAPPVEVLVSAIEKTFGMEETPEGRRLAVGEEKDGGR